MPSPAAQAKVELTFWKHSHPPADTLTQTIIDEYMKQNPNVSIKMEIIPSDQWLNKILTAASGGQLPDIFDTNDANHAIFVSRNLLAPVDAAAFGFKDQADLEKNYVKDSLNPFKGADGKVYGMPFEYNSWTMVINDKIFKEAGLDPEKDYPKTWEEVGTLGAKLAKVTDGKFERQGFAWNSADGWLDDAALLAACLPTWWLDPQRRRQGQNLRVEQPGRHQGAGDDAGDV